MPTVDFLNNYGTLTYTVSKTGAIGKDDEITVKFTFKPTKQKMYGYEISIRNPQRPASGKIIAEGAKSISKGGSGSVTLTFKPGSEMTALYFSDRSAALVMEVSMALNSAMDEYETTDPFQTGVTVIERIAPVISNMTLAETTWADTSDIVIFPPPAENLPLNIFGMFVQNVSKPKVTADITLDPLDTKLTANYTLTLKQGDTELYSAGGSVTNNVIKNLTGKITAHGDVECVLTVTDSAGMSASTTVLFTVLQYSRTAISRFTPKRYEYGYDVNGDYVLQESDTGKIVVFDFTGSITPISGNGENNFGKLSITYGPAYDETDRTTIVIGSATAAEFNVTHQIADVVFSDSEDYTFVASFSDYFSTTKETAEIYKAGGELDVTPVGVAVGQISSGTLVHKKFEVAPTHESFFRGGISGVTNYPAAGVEELTGGRWGRKPIYRQVLTYTVSTVDSTLNGPTIADFGELVSMTGRFYRTSDPMYHQLNFYRTSSDYNYAYMSIDGVLRVRSSDKAIVTAIVEYTKSTD